MIVVPRLYNFFFSDTFWIYRICLIIIYAFCQIHAIFSFVIIFKRYSHIFLSRTRSEQINGTIYCSFVVRVIVFCYIGFHRMNIFHSGIFNGFFFVKPLKDIAVFAKSHSFHSQFFCCFYVFTKLCNAIYIGYSI